MDNRDVDGIELDEDNSPALLDFDYEHDIDGEQEDRALSIEDFNDQLSQFIQSSEEQFAEEEAAPEEDVAGSPSGGIVPKALQTKKRGKAATMVSTSTAANRLWKYLTPQVGRYYVECELLSRIKSTKIGQGVWGDYSIDVKPNFAEEFLLKLTKQQLNSFNANCLKQINGMRYHRRKANDDHYVHKDLMPHEVSEKDCTLLWVQEVVMKPLLQLVNFSREVKDFFHEEDVWNFIVVCLGYFFAK
jgi:hypothetical protein